MGGDVTEKGDGGPVPRGLVFLRQRDRPVGRPVDWVSGNQGDNWPLRTCSVVASCPLWGTVRTLPGCLLFISCLGAQGHVSLGALLLPLPCASQPPHPANPRALPSFMGRVTGDCTSSCLLHAGGGGDAAWSPWSRDSAVRLGTQPSAGLATCLHSHDPRRACRAQAPAVGWRRALGSGGCHGHVRVGPEAEAGPPGRHSATLARPAPPGLSGS